LEQEGVHATLYGVVVGVGVGIVICDLLGVLVGTRGEHHRIGS
jgi:putative Ca2+/H+ antiporter (TMEM165/GDT1 family)